MGKLNLILSYSCILHIAMLSILGVLSIFESRYLVLFLAVSFLALVITSLSLFATGVIYLILYCISQIISYLSSTDIRTTKIEYSNGYPYLPHVKWISLVLLALFFILLYVYTYHTQHIPAQYINENRELILFGLTCLWMLSGMGILAYLHIKAYINWAGQESITEETIKLKAKNDHRISIIGQCLYLPLFLFVIYVLTHSS